jgi:hypothetical protein
MGFCVTFVLQFVVGFWCCFGVCAGGGMFLCVCGCVTVFVYGYSV